MKTAGVVFDFYDDASGKILKEYFSSPEELPQIIKMAHILNPEEREVLRDEAYALVMLNDGEVLRKFACVDAGNTLLSLAYFEKTAESLPDEAVQFAADRLIGFCNEFGIEPTELVKVAAAANGMSRERDSFRQPVAGDEADWAARTNLMSLRGGSDSGRVIPVASQMKTSSASGPDTERNIGVRSPTIDTQNLVPSSTGMETPTVVPGPKAEIIDVTRKSPPLKIEKKSSAMYALGDKYPLDSYSDVSKAVEYFGDYWKLMDPGDRHEYCVKTASRAEDLGIPVPEVMQRYGSVSYAPDLEAYMVSRMEKCASEFQGAYQELYDQRSSLDPEEFAAVLAKVDSVAGMERLYGNHIMDPWFTTFGGMSEKTASDSWSWSSDTGDLVTSENLHWLAREGRGLVKKQFSHDIADAFASNPIQIFESMPDTHKKILCNMANTRFDGPSSN